MNSESDLSRRALLRSSVTLAAAAATSAGGLLLAGCEGNDDGLVRGEAGTPSGTGGESGALESGLDAAAAANDISILRALVVGEYGIIDAYAAGASILGAPAADDPLAGLAPVLLAVALSFHDQHVAHANALNAAVTALGGTVLATSSVQFVAPAGFTPSVTNVLKLACNAERAASIAYVDAVSNLVASANRFLAVSIEGDDTQHFMALYAVLMGLVDPGPSLSALTAGQLVPVPFVASVGPAQSLEDLPDFDVTM